jgi:hypothetical protein
MCEVRKSEGDLAAFVSGKELEILDAGGINGVKSGFILT